MPKYVKNATASTHRFTFLVDGEPVTPSAASYTLSKNDGTVVGGLNSVSITPTGTSTVVSVSGANNTPTLAYEVRYLDVSYTFEGAVYSDKVYYVLRASVAFPLTPEDVSSVIGASVPDDYIDILAAYDLVKLDVPDTNLDNILTNGTALLPALIDAVKFKAAMGSAMGLENSMFQMEQADNTLYKRFASVDFGSLRDGLLAQYNNALNKLAGVGGDSYTTPLYSLMAQGIDPITNT